MQISSFYGVVSARLGIECAMQEIGGSHSVRLRELGHYHLELQGSSFCACADDFGILLDGRIYNITELSAQLDTELPDDSELLLHAYRQWGTEFPRYLEGDFAFVLWDRTAARVLLGCGSDGSFPLFYAQHSEEFIFARNLRDLLAKIGVPPRINEDYLARWLALIHVGSRSTFFENIFRVIPGSVIIFEQGRIRQDIYWQPEKISSLRLRDSREYADGLREALKQAIQNRLSGCTVAGSQLSGGLDSSAVSSLAAEILHGENRRLYAFTAVPAHPVDDLTGRFCDEGPAATLVATMLPNVDHVLVRHGHHSVFTLMDLFGSEQMEPIFNPANYDWLYEICLQARQRQLNALFVGDSGNISVSHDGRFALQSLASEGRFIALARLAFEMHRNGSRRWLGIANELFGPWMPLEVRYFLNKRRKKLKSVFEYSMIRHEFARCHGLDTMTLEQNHERLDSKSLRIRYLRRPEVGASIDAFRRLTGVSRLDPTADRRVIEYCLSVPVEYYCEKGVPRSLIRNAMIGRLPEQVRTERRRGLQAADFAIHFEREREEALAELARMKKVDLAVRALDLEKLEQMMHWSVEQIAAHGGMMCYWPKILRAFSLGRFLRRFEDGTLFSFSRDQG